MPPAGTMFRMQTGEEEHMNDAAFIEQAEVREVVGGPVLGYLLSILSLVLMMVA